MINILPVLETALGIASKVATTASVTKSIVDTFDDSSSTKQPLTVQNTNPICIPDRKIEVIESQNKNQQQPHFTINVNVFVNGKKDPIIESKGSMVHLITEIE